MSDVVVYRKRGITFRGDFPLTQLCVELSKLNEEYYWKPLVKKVMADMTRRIDNAYTRPKMF